MITYLLFFALFSVSAASLIIILAEFENDEVRLPWALRIWAVICLALFVRLGVFAGPPWNKMAIGFAAYWAVVYPLICIPNEFWRNLVHKLDRFWNAAEYARIEHEQAERREIYRRQEAIRQQEELERRKTDRELRALVRWRLEAEQKRIEDLRLKKEAEEKAIAEQKERDRRAAIIQDLRNSDEDEFPEF